MNQGTERRRRAQCSFCGKDESQVRKLVAGPGVFICDQCVELCNQVIKEDSGGSPRTDQKSHGYRPSSGRRGWFRHLLPSRITAPA